MATTPTTGPSASTETPAQATTVADSEATIAFHQRTTRIDQEAEEHAVAHQHAEDKYTIHERIDDLLDSSTFLETGHYSGSDAGDKARPSGAVTGFGQIDGRQMAVYSRDSSISGGALGAIEGDKVVRLLDDTLRLRIPVIGLANSGGTKIQEGAGALCQYGRILNRTYAASGLILQISVILGPCTGGVAYSPALTDFVIATRQASYMFVTDLDVVRAITGEQVNAEDLGDVQTHGSVSGVVRYVADDEEDALRQIHTFLAYLFSFSEVDAPLYAYDDVDAQVDAEAVHSVGEIVPTFTRQTCDTVEVVSTVVDHSELVRVREGSIPNITVDFVCFEGHPVGIIANQLLVDAGTLDIDAFEKLVRFVCSYGAFRLSVVTFVDVPGYRPGTEQEHASITRYGAKVINTYATTTVPLVTIVPHKAYGGAYIAVSPKAIGADLNLYWLGAEIAILGATGAVGIIHRRDLAKVRDEQGGEAATAERERFMAEYTDTVINPDKAMATGEIDAVIAPGDTRNVIVDSLAALRAEDDARPESPKKYDSIPL